MRACVRACVRACMRAWERACYFQVFMILYLNKLWLYVIDTLREDLLRKIIVIVRSTSVTSLQFLVHTSTVIDGVAFCGQIFIES